MLTAVVVGVLVAAAALLAGRIPSTVRLRTLIGSDPGAARPARQRFPSWSTVVAGGGGGVSRWLRRAGSGSAADADAAMLAEQVAALSRAGLPWPRVWQALADTPGPEAAVCAAVTRHVSTGGTAGDGLRSAGGSPPLGWLAVACDVAEQAGAPVADVLDRFAAAARADAAAAADRDAALAGPRATATVLSWLPLGGLGLGLLIGADPVGTLFGTEAGRACLIAGVGLWLLGHWWTRTLVRRAERAGQ